MMENNQSFEYTYSAPEQEEIRRIREKYLPKDEYASKLDQLKKLDKMTERKGTIISIVLGIIGTLLFGTGLSFVLALTQYFVPGIIIGVVGMIVLASALPAYMHITKKEREKVADEILKLTEELMR